MSRSCGASIATVHRILERITEILGSLPELQLRGVQVLEKESPEGTKIAIDATECQRNRPVKGQKDYFSGRKKMHTVKGQIIINLQTLEILAVAVAPGAKHDFALCKETWESIPKEVEVYADRGYQGIQKLHENSKIPHKKLKNGELTDEQKNYNREHARIRIPIEHKNREIKLFKIFAEPYRGSLKKFETLLRITCGLINMEKGCSA